MAVLKLGSRGKAVEAWQLALLDVGLYGTASPLDGVFGPITVGVTRSFQAQSRLVADGVVGPKTRVAMGGETFSGDGLEAAMLAVAAVTTRTVDSYIVPLGEAVLAKGIGIVTRARLAAFVAQLAHESGGFKFWRELWGPTVAQKRYEPPSALARQLGNTQRGDGYRYRGRGPIQLTGRANYRAAGQVLGVDLELHPDMVSLPATGFRTSAWFWSTRNLNALADKQTVKAFDQLGGKINGKTPPNGAADRRALWARARAALGIA